jgi:hypothetical protein
MAREYSVASRINGESLLCFQERSADFKYCNGLPRDFDIAQTREVGFLATTYVNYVATLHPMISF